MATLTAATPTTDVAIAALFTPTSSPRASALIRTTITLPPARAASPAAPTLSLTPQHKLQRGV
eukprot:1406476-Pleurochrysis_carterae.AAC.2